MFFSLYAGHHLVGDDDDATVGVSRNGPAVLSPGHLSSKRLVSGLGSKDCSTDWALDVVFAFHHPLDTARVELVSTIVQLDFAKSFIYRTVILKFLKTYLAIIILNSIHSRCVFIHSKNGQFIISKLS